MSKVFLYLYPIREYTEFFMLSEDSLYDEWNIKRPLPILNECIDKRYRDKGYKVVFAIYPDREIFGIDLKENDEIIYTDVLFTEASGVDENMNIKKNFTPKYPNEKMLIDQLGDVDELIVGGYHAQDCVKRVAECALNLGINTLIDLDLTDYFFSLYKKDKYFDVSSYSPKRYMEYIYSEADKNEEKHIDSYFKETYSSKAYGFDLNDDVKKL